MDSQDESLADRSDWEDREEEEKKGRWDMQDSPGEFPAVAIPVPASAMSVPPSTPRDPATGEIMRPKKKNKVNITRRC